MKKTHTYYKITKYFYYKILKRKTYDIPDAGIPMGGERHRPPAPRPPHACRSREASIRLVFAPFVTLKTIVHKRTFSKLNLQHLLENDVGRHPSVSNYFNISTDVQNYMFGIGSRVE